MPSSLARPFQTRPVKWQSQSTPSLKYEGKSLNKRNFILSAWKIMHNEKSYFGTQNGSLTICHIGVVTIEQYEPAQ